jgi:hypothetical protein
MRVVSIIIRFVQILAILPVGIGISHAGSFFELLNELAQGQPWNFAEFAPRLAAFSSPTGLGVALIVGLQLILRQGKKTHARSLRFPDQPWLWKPMWAERRIRLSNRTTILALLAAFILYAFVLVPVLLWMLSQKPLGIIYVFLVVPGLFLLALMRATWLNRRWGRSELEILTLPGVIGGPFRGTVILSESLPEGTSLRVTLNCIRRRTVRMRPSHDTNSVTDTIWQDQKILVTALSMSRDNGVAIPCSFAIPFSCEPTSLDTITFSRVPDPDEVVSIHWELSVGMKDPLDVHAVAFEIPVFRTEDSSRDYQEDATATIDTPYLESVDIDALVESLPLQREYSASSELLRFSLMGKRDFVLFLLFTLAVTVGVWAIFRYVSMPGALFAAFLPVVLAIACYKTLVEALTWKAEIEITASATIFTVGYVWSRRRYEFPRGKLPRLECREEMRRQSGSTYAVRMVPAEGPPCDLIKRLDGKHNATAVRDWLMKELWKA